MRVSFDAFVGIPWADRGRTAAGCDCKGLVALVYKELRGIDVAAYADDYPTAADRAEVEVVVNGDLGPFRKIYDQHRPFDVVLLRERPWHVGVITRPGWMLHMPADKTSVIEQYTTGRHASRVEAVYRHIMLEASEP